MRKIILSLIVLFIVILTQLHGLAAQKSVVVVASRDNTIFSESPGNSNGSGDYLFSGRTSTTADGNRRALVYFDIKDSVPAGNVIDSAILTLNVNRGNFTSPSPVSVHRLSKTWGEENSHAEGDEGKGVSAVAGDATWSHNLFNTESWTTPGGDFESTVSSTSSVTALEPVHWEGEGLLADVNLWLQDDSKNHGWILVGDESVQKTAQRYASRENSSEESRPMLTIYYSEQAVNAPSLEVSDMDSFKAFPNPFRDELSISYIVKSGEVVQLGIYNLLGQQVRMIRKGHQSPGRYHYTWDGTSSFGKTVPTGMYYVILGKGENKQVLKIIKTR